MYLVRSVAIAPLMMALLGGVAHAALTADQVWQSWQSAAAEQGTQLEAATTARSGTTLTLNGVSFGPKDGDGLTISDISLTELSDGSVEIKPGAAIGANSDDGDSKGTLKVTHDDLLIIAKEGNAGGILYSFTADAMEVKVTSSQQGFSYSEEPAEPVTMDITATIGELSGSYGDIPGDNRKFDLDIAAKTLAYGVVSVDPNMESKSTSTTEAQDLVGTLDVTLPSAIKMSELDSSEDFAKAVESGFAVAGTFSQGVSTSVTNEEGAMLPVKITAVAEPSTGDFVFSKDGLSINGTSDGAVMDIVSEMIPVPVKVTLGRSILGLLAPVVTNDKAGDMAIKLDLEGLSVNDEAWALVDPEAKLPREPLVAKIDVTGKVLADWFAVAEGATPQPQSLDINAIALSVAGAALNATGAFTFDNSMGLPMPVGNADISLKGANQLITSLQAMGLISEDDAMGANMMVGMFMTAAGEDSYVSKIEAKEGGSVFVNGQQIQ